MSFEREAIVETSNPIPSSMPLMREERVINPYNPSPKSKITAAPAATGQQNISSDAAEPGAPVETVTLSPHMAALARKEQAFRQREQAFKTEKAALEARAAKLAQLEELEKKLAAKDYSGIEDKVSYEDYTKYLIEKSGSTTPEQQALKALAEKVDSVEKSHQEDTERRFKAAVEDRRNAVKTLVDTNPEYVSLKKGGKVIQEAVVKHILDTWEHDNTELSPEQAAKEVKEALRQKKQELDALFEEQQIAEVDTKKNLPPLKTNVKTLTNQMTVGDIKRPQKSFQGMSDAERYAEARRRAEEKLQKGK